MRIYTRNRHRFAHAGVTFLLHLIGVDPVSHAGQDKDPFSPFWETRVQKFQDAFTLPNIRPFQLRLLGMAWVDLKKQNLRILVELPDGKSAILTPETLIGPYQGKIIEVRERSIVVVEICQNILGQPEKKLTVLTLSPEESHE